MGKEMTSKERLERTWNFQEPDRVPIEMNIMAEATQDPRSASHKGRGLVFAAVSMIWILDKS